MPRKKEEITEEMVNQETNLPEPEVNVDMLSDEVSLEDEAELLFPEEKDETVEDGSEETDIPLNEKGESEQERTKTDTPKNQPSYKNPLMPDELSKGDRVVKAGRRTKRKLYNEGIIMTEDGPKKIPVQDTQRHIEYMELVGSSKRKNILRGRLLGRRETENGRILASVQYGEKWIVYIPAEYFIDLSLQAPIKDNQIAEVVYKSAINKRMGAMIDFIVIEVDEAGGIAYGSHIDAMMQKARLNYTITRGGQEPRIQTGMTLEAQVMQVNSIGIFVQAFGAECFIKNNEVDWLRRGDISRLYSPGQKINVKLLAVKPHQIKIKTKNNERTINTVTIECSIKQLRPNPNEVYFNQFDVHTQGLGEVTQVTESGIFVIFQNKISVMCTLFESQSGKQPLVGDRVLVIINKKKEETFGFLGEIKKILSELRD